MMMMGMAILYTQNIWLNKVTWLVYCQNLMSSPTSFHLFTILLDVLTSIFMFWDSGIGGKIFTCGPSLHAKSWTASHWNTQGSTKISIICITKNFIMFLTYVISDIILQYLAPQPLAMDIYGLEWSSIVKQEFGPQLLNICYD